jgi:hypothetical protein
MAELSWEDFMGAILSSERDLPRCASGCRISEREMNPESAWRDTVCDRVPDAGQRFSKDVSFEEGFQWAIQILEIVRECIAGDKLHNGGSNCQQQFVINLVQIFS